MATLVTTFGGAYLYSKAGKSSQPQTPPTNSQSPDEEKFIQYV